LDLFAIYGDLIGSSWTTSAFRTWQLDRSAADGVPQDDHTVADPTLLDQRQVQPYTVRKEPLSAADEHGANNRLELVDKTRPYRLCGKFRTEM
jgi:hypothetical protein